jgi:hypothetical protein
MELAPFEVELAFRWSFLDLAGNFLNLQMDIAVTPCSGWRKPKEENGHGYGSHCKQ